MAVGDRPPADTGNGATGLDVLRHAAPDWLGGRMAESPTRACCGQDSSLSTADRRTVGEQRRILVRRAALAASAGLCSAALTLSMLGMGQTTLAHRLCWGSAACASAVLAGWVRQAMIAGRPGWRLVAAIVVLAVGIGWQPLGPALAAVAALAEHVLRPGIAQPGARLPVAERVVAGRRTTGSGRGAGVNG